jgi:hypothetical protein
MMAHPEIAHVARVLGHEPGIVCRPRLQTIVGAAQGLVARYLLTSGSALVSKAVRMAPFPRT